LSRIYLISGAVAADNRVERRLAAILAADVAGYSRPMGVDEEWVLARLKTARKSLVDPTVATHRGRIVKTTGDGMLVEFASAVDATRCAIERLISSLAMHLASTRARSLNLSEPFTMAPWMRSRSYPRRF
jgi:class 3 adenylate cyclase